MTDHLISRKGIVGNFADRDSVDEPARENLTRVVQDFSAAWTQHERPSVVHYVQNSSGCDRAELAAELIRVDLDRRLKLGEEVRIDEYLCDIPELRNSEVELVALLIDEHSLRTEAGQVVTLDEYARRFPEHLETLRNELGQTDNRNQTLNATEVENPSVHAVELDDAQVAEVEFNPGSVVGDFRIGRLLGSGGVSRVFLATQLSLERRVALKVTPDCDEDSSSAYEGRTMAALSHPHIVPVFAEQRLGSLRLLAMEYVSGPTLADFLTMARDRFYASKSSQMPTAAEALSLIEEFSAVTLPRENRQTGGESEIGKTRALHGSSRNFLCGVVRDVARALAAAAAKGVLHSDVKPANILLTGAGKALIADFNVSLRNDSSVRDGTAVGGTLLYMSPEQLGNLTGSDRERGLDERSDIYSLGLILFESLTDGWPFLERNLSSDPLIAAGQLQASRLSSSVEYPAGCRSLTPGLKSIIEKCLAPEPSDRYVNGEELADDLDRFLDHRPLKTAVDRSWIERGTKWIKRNPPRAVLMSIVFTFLAVTLFVLRSERSLAVLSPQDALQTPAAGQASSGVDAERRARQSDLAGQKLLRERDFSTAAFQFELAVKLNPQMATAWHNLGVARFRLGIFADSLSAFDRSIALGNESGRAYSHRAAARFALGDESGAEADFETAMQIATLDEQAEVRANVRDFETLRASKARLQSE